MLLIDGVKFEAWTPTDEDALETMVQEHASDIFGPDCLYFDLKHKLKGNSVAAIPDGYAITFNPDQWWIVEVELSSHPVYEHIQNQVGRFIAALPNPNTRPEVIKALWQEINADKILLARLQNSEGGEIYKWLSDLIGQSPQLAIIIDEKAQGLDDAIAALKIKPKVVEFVTYTRENVGLVVHGHRFEPVLQTATIAVPLKGIENTSEEATGSTKGKTKPSRKNEKLKHRRGSTPVTVTIDGKVPSSWADACRMVGIYVGANSAKRAWDAGYSKLAFEQKARVKGM